MIAFKGFNEALQCTCGAGTYQYQKGEIIREEASKTASKGFHSAEYILDCLKWYPLDGKNRYFRVKAGGSIDEEEGDTKIASTEITLKDELGILEVAGEAISYMLKHPKRAWEASGKNLDVSREQAECRNGYGIAIARGIAPKVRGESGAVLGIVQEDEQGKILAAGLYIVGKGNVRENVWYTIRDGQMKEAV